MTQPTPPPQSNAQVIAAATIALALIALESRVRQDIDDDIKTAFHAIAAAGVLAASTAPATVLTGVALLSLATVHTAITSNLDTMRDKLSLTIQTGYSAAAQIAYTKLRADLGADNLPAALPELGDNADRLLADIDTMTGHAQTDIQNSIAAAFDGVQGPDAKTARLITINQAVSGAGARLAHRAQAAGATAVHTGSTDAQQALFDAYQNNTGIPGLMKRWVVTSATPCGMCEALNGTVVGINAEFDHNATTVDRDLRRIWRNLSGPPRHPNCRCQLELVKT